MRRKDRRDVVIESGAVGTPYEIVVTAGGHFGPTTYRMAVVVELGMAVKSIAIMENGVTVGTVTA